MTRSATDSPKAAGNHWALGMLHDACAEVGLDPTDARLAKFTNNAVYLLAKSPITIRIAGSSTVAQRIPKVLAAARWLAVHDAPAVRLIDDLPQPLIVRGLPVTFWHTVSTNAQSSAPTAGDLGRILRAIHELPAPPISLPAWDPLRGIRQRLREQNVLTTSEHRFLTDSCDELSDALDHVHYESAPGPIHGDAFVGNLIAGPSGPVICDFDSAATGPREWDLTPVAVGHLRFRYPGNPHHELAAAYCRDILQWPDFPTFRRLRELQLVTSVLPVLPANPTLSEQWRHRLTTFRTNDITAQWSPYK